MPSSVGRADVRSLRLAWCFVISSCALAVLVIWGIWTASTVIRSVHSCVEEAQERGARRAAAIAGPSRQIRAILSERDGLGLTDVSALCALQELRSSLCTQPSPSSKGPHGSSQESAWLISSIEAIEAELVRWRNHSFPVLTDLRTTTTLGAFRETVRQLVWRLVEASRTRGMVAGAAGTTQDAAGAPADEPPAQTGPPCSTCEVQRATVRALTSLMLVSYHGEQIALAENRRRLDDAAEAELRIALEQFQSAAAEALQSSPDPAGVIDLQASLREAALGSQAGDAGLLGNRRSLLELRAEEERLRSSLLSLLDGVDRTHGSIAAVTGEQMHGVLSRMTQAVQRRLQLLQALTALMIVIFLSLCLVFARRIQAQSAALDVVSAEATSAERLKSEFLTTVSHEFRTPINQILGMATVLLDGELSPEQRALIVDARRSGESLLKLVEDVLEYSRLRAGNEKLEVASYFLDVAVEETLESIAEEAQTKGLELMSVLKPDVPIAVRGDGAKYRRVLQSLISNAVKFTEHGEVVVQVEVLSAAEGRETVLRTSVTDSGIGLAQDAANHLFDPFTQGDGSVTRSHGGVGLGLALGRELVALMGGEIGVQSTPGSGSRFWFSTKVFAHPLAPAADRALAVLSGKRVCVVDDNETARGLSLQQLSSWGLSGTAYADKTSAMRALRDAAASGKPFHLALVDGEMPSCEGLEIVAEIRRDLRLTKLPVVLLAPIKQRGLRRQAFESGVNAFLLKPVRHAHLRSSILEILSSSKSATQEAAAPPPPLERLEFPCRVLVVEANFVTQKALLRILREVGAGVQPASSGREALESLRTERFDAILLDCRMPGMNGFETAAAIRAQAPDGTRTPIIGLSAQVEGELWTRCLAAGMDECLPIPLRAQEIRAALERWAFPPERLELSKQGQRHTPSAFW